MSVSQLRQRALHHLQKQQLPEAEQLFRQILSLSPKDDDALFMLGMIYYNKKSYKEALTLISKALQLSTTNPRYYYNLGVVWRDYGDITKALACFTRATELKPDYTAAYFNKGVIEHNAGNYDVALAAYRQVIMLEPNHQGAHNNIGGICYFLGRYNEAIEAYQHLLHLAPNDAGALNNLAIVLKDMNRPEESTALLEKATSLAGDQSYVYSNLICNLHYDPKQDRNSLFAAHKEWNTRYGAPLQYHITRHDNDRTLGRILNIGYVSGDFRAHPVGFFLMKSLIYRNKDQIKLHCYSTSKTSDNVSTQIQKHSDCWRDISALDDAQAAALIRKDAIDILVDLSGHTADNRLSLFARKPAPIQASWLGYFNTTGLYTIDYFISDFTHAPQGYEQWFTETLIRMPDCYMCYTPPKDAPTPVPAPVLTNGIITFGCFNNISKINNDVITLWATILHKVPHSRLVLKSKALNNPDIQHYYHDAFATHGITPDRIILQGWSAHKELLREYLTIDIALDPFPFSGGLTSCETLWMGIPIITYAGEWIVSRQTASYLTQIGLSALIADNKTSYIDLAVHLSHNTAALSSLRHNLRERMAASPLCDGKRFAANLEAAYREMWQRYIQG